VKIWVPWKKWDGGYLHDRDDANCHDRGGARDLLLGDRLTG
jgi:hypothetical protein